MPHKVERIWKEAVMVKCKPFPHFDICFERLRKPRKTLVRIAGFRSQIENRDLPNTK